MATKKITELPFINTLSGSTVFDNPVLNTVIPVVLYGTTNQITVENFSEFTNLYAAQTGSQNTFTAQNIFNQNQWFNAIVSASTINVGTLGVGGNTTIIGTLGVTGNGTIGGNLVVNGKLTAQEVYTEITSASIIFESGSTKFGDDTGDKHQFTGSINVSGSVIYNGVILTNIDANTIQRLQQATASIELASASFNYFYQSTASLNTFTASQDSRNFTLSQVTGSFAGEIGGLEAYTASLKGQAIVSSSTQVQNYDLFALNSVLYIATGSIKGEIAGIEAYTASLKSAAIVSSSTQVQNYDLFALNSNLYISTGSIKGEIAGLESYTASLKGQAIVSSSTQVQNYDVFALNSNLYTSTGSLIGITNGLMAFTAALDNTYATDVQLYQLYQATRSLELHSGSMIGVTNGLMAYTASNETWKDGVRGEISGIEAYTASLKGQAIVSSSTQVQNYDVFALNSNLYTSTGSLIGITNGLMAFTAALDSTYATDAQLFQLYQATRSIELTTGSLIGITNGLMAFTAALDNTYATDAQLYQLYQATQSLELTTGSLIGITNGLMAFTAALDSTYATDAQLYQLYAETASIKAEIGGIEAYTASLKGAFTIDGNNDVYFTGKITTQEVHTTYTTSSVLFQSGSTKLGNSFDDKHEITGSLNTSFGGRGGLFVNDGFQKTFTFPTGNLFSIDFGSAEGGGFVDVTYGGVVTSIGGRGGATRYAIAYKNATDAVATKVHGYGDDIVSASISATKVAIFSIGGDAVQSSKYQLNVSVNAVAADGAGDYDVIQYKRL